MAEPASDREGGGAAPGWADEPAAVYEVRLEGLPESGLRRQFPTASVTTTRTETVLYTHVERPAELDALLAQLLSLGLVLTEVRQCTEPGGRVAAHPRGGAAR